MSNVKKEKIRCNSPKALTEILGMHTNTNTSTDGANKYTFNNERIVNVYETGTVNFQGKITDSNQEEQIKEIIKIINNPLCADSNKKSQ